MTKVTISTEGLRIQIDLGKAYKITNPYGHRVMEAICASIHETGISFLVYGGGDDSHFVLFEDIRDGIKAIEKVDAAIPEIEKVEG